MKSVQVEALRQILKGTQKARAEVGEGADKLFDALKSKQKEFNKSKERIEDDIKRGARVSRGKIPR